LLTAKFNNRKLQHIGAIHGLPLYVVILRKSYRCIRFILKFSIATLLPREIQSLRNPNILEGTLAYISPEQTGRMNRGIDYRNDFYSLGVTFFQLLIGHLPFTTKDPMELVYSHIAKQPLKASLINFKYSTNFI
jgi:serine/threonine protein kinase